MKRSFPVLRGRGADADPPNRFERLHVEPLPEDEEDPTLRPTQYFVDHSRSVLTTNDSPDVGFDWSLNPYRGCVHGCVYCLDPETRVLLADLTSRAIGDLIEGQLLLGFDEYPQPGGERKLRTARLEAVWRSRKPTIRIVTNRGEVVTTAEHRWLVEDSRWRATHGLRPGMRLRYLNWRSDEPGFPSRGIEKCERHIGLVPPTEPATILAIEPGPIRDVVDIQTSTATFYANGLATHNCFARPTHEYLGLSAGLDFESKIFVKTDAPELLEKRISHPRWEPKPITLSGVTDGYQPIERRLGITRRCLEILARARHPVTIVTKSRLVTRDVDLLAELARFDAAHVAISLTTLDRALQRAMEPRASPPEHRLEAIRTLSDAGVPVTVLMAPVIPGLTDHEIPAVVQAAADAGARGVGHVLLRLPGAVEEVFLSWLDDHSPGRAEKVKSRLRSMRGGKLYDARFGKRMRGEGPFAEQIDAMFQVAVSRARFPEGGRSLTGRHFIRPEAPRESARSQLDLF